MSKTIKPSVLPHSVRRPRFISFANKRAACDGHFADGSKVILYNGDAAVIAEWSQLSDDGRVDSRVLPKQFGDGGFEGVEFAGALAAGRLLHWCTQIHRESAAADPLRSYATTISPPSGDDEFRCSF